jgi:hypothetical protein
MSDWSLLGRRFDDRISDCLSPPCPVLSSKERFHDEIK